MLSEMQKLSLARDNGKDMMVVTRIHTNHAHKIATPKEVEAFCISAAHYASKVVVCIGHAGDAIEDERLMLNCAEYMSTLNDHLQLKLKPAVYKKVSLLPIHPWGNFTNALNGAVELAVRENFAYICFQSLEFRIPTESVAHIRGYVGGHPNTMVAGPAMEGHEFQAGNSEVPLRGRTCPWNTFAVWSVSHLALLGFPMVADGLGTGLGGVEEVSAFALAHYLYPNLEAALLQVPGIDWNVHFKDAKRAAYHKTKMESKDARPQHHLEALGLCGSGSKVCHVVLAED